MTVFIFIFLKPCPRLNAHTLGDEPKTWRRPGQDEEFAASHPKLDKQANKQRVKTEKQSVFNGSLHTDVLLLYQRIKTFCHVISYCRPVYSPNLTVMMWRRHQLRGFLGYYKCYRFLSPKKCQMCWGNKQVLSFGCTVTGRDELTLHSDVLNVSAQSICWRLFYSYKQSHLDYVLFGWRVVVQVLNVWM